VEIVAIFVEPMIIFAGTALTPTITIEVEEVETIKATIAETTNEAIRTLAS